MTTPVRATRESGSAPPRPRAVSTARANSAGIAGGEDRTVRASIRPPSSGTQQRLAADPHDLAVDAGAAGLRQPGDRLGDVDRQPALLQRVDPGSELAAAEGHRRRPPGGG